MAPDGTIDGAGIDVTDGTFRQALRGAAPRENLPQPWGVSATATLYRVEALRECAVGGSMLHPVLFAYYEDVELCVRLLAKGWELYLDPRPLASHRGSSSGDKLGATKLWLQTRNRYIVNRLHPGAGRRVALYCEDVRSVAKRLGRFDLSGAWRVLSGVVAGLMTTITEPADDDSV
jgi:GT2 family glycosyltransferase